MQALVRSQAYMALSAAAFVGICAALLGRSLDWPWYLLATVGCWWVYLADAGLGLAQEDRINVPARVEFLTRHRRTLAIILALLTLISAIAILKKSGLGARTAILLGALLVVACGYVFPIVPRRKKPSRRLKESELLKPVIVSVAWLAGAMLLVVLQGRPIANPAAPPPVIAAFLFLLLFGDSVALDWRDREGDRHHGIETWAVRLGRATPWLFAAGCFIAAALIYFNSVNRLWCAAALTMLLTHAATLPLFPAARRHPLFFYIVVAAWRFSGLIPMLIFSRA